jgi:hypothetical protein
MEFNNNDFIDIDIDIDNPEKNSNILITTIRTITIESSNSKTNLGRAISRALEASPNIVIENACEIASAEYPQKLISANNKLNHAFNTEEINLALRNLLLTFAENCISRICTDKPLDKQQEVKVIALKERISNAAFNNTNDFFKLLLDTKRILWQLTAKTIVENKTEYSYISECLFIIFSLLFFSTDEEFITSLENKKRYATINTNHALQHLYNALRKHGITNGAANEKITRILKQALLQKTEDYLNTQRHLTTYLQNMAAELNSRPPLENMILEFLQENFNITKPSTSYIEVSAAPKKLDHESIYPQESASENTTTKAITTLQKSVDGNTDRLITIIDAYITLVLNKYPDCSEAIHNHTTKLADGKPNYKIENMDDFLSVLTRIKNKFNWYPCHDFTETVYQDILAKIKLILACSLFTKNQVFSLPPTANRKNLNQSLLQFYSAITSRTTKIQPASNNQKTALIKALQAITAAEAQLTYEENKSNLVRKYNTGNTKLAATSRHSVFAASRLNELSAQIRAEIMRRADRKK